MRRAALHPVQRSADEVGRTEAREQLDVYPEIPEPLARRLVVLRREQRRRSEYDRLLRLDHRLENRAERDLGLAVADVAAKQSVHHSAALHVLFDLGDGAQLVGRLFVRECVLEPLLIVGVRFVAIALAALPLRIERGEVDRHLFDRLGDLSLYLFKLFAAQLGQPRHALAARVARQPVQLIYGHLQQAAVAVFDDDVVAHYALKFYLFNAQTSAYAVHLVYDIVALARQGEQPRSARRRPDRPRTRNVPHPYRDELYPRQTKAVRQRDRSRGQRARDKVDVVGDPARDVVVFERHRDALRPRPVAHAQRDRIARMHVVGEVGIELLDVERIVLDPRERGRKRPFRRIYSVGRARGDKAGNAPLCQPRERFVRRGETVHVRAQHLSVHGERLDPLPVLAQIEFELFGDPGRIVDKDVRAVGKIVEQRKARHRQPRQQPLEVLPYRGLRLEFGDDRVKPVACVSVRLGDDLFCGGKRAAHLFRSREHVARRHKVEPVFDRERAHRLGIECLDALHLIAEKGYPQRSLSVGREHRQYVAVQRERVLFLRRVAAYVAKRRQLFGKSDRVALAAHRDGRRACDEPLSLRHILHERLCARHAAVEPALGKPHEHGHAFGERARLKALAIDEHVVLGRQVGDPALGQPLRNTLGQSAR